MEKSKKTAKKKRSSKYDKKLAIGGSFADVIRVSVQTEVKKKDTKKGGKNKKK